MIVHMLLFSRSCARLVVTPWPAAHACSSVHGIYQARLLEWVANFSSSGDIPNSTEAGTLCLQVDFFLPTEPLKTDNEQINVLPSLGAPTQFTLPILL